jgi:hypothetical protein
LDALVAKTKIGETNVLIRLVPIRFIFYMFSLLLFVACFTVVFVVVNDCQKINLIGTDRKLTGASDVHVHLL